jgi:hypothetical protein
MSKEALVERLITAERTLAEQRERWLSTSYHKFFPSLTAPM